MKKQFLSIVLALPVFFFVSCEKDHSPQEVKDTLSSGTWHVSYYSIGADPSFALDNYDFTFSSDGTAMAHGDGTHVEGIWSISEVDGDNILDLYLGHSSPFDELDAAWEINSLSATRVETENDNDSSIDLTFEKN